MKRDHAKDAIYGALEEILSDGRYFWPGFSKSTLTEEGEEAIKGLILTMGRAIVDARRNYLEELARNITFNQLKKD